MKLCTKLTEWLVVLSTFHLELTIKIDYKFSICEGYEMQEWAEGGNMAIMTDIMSQPT